MPVLNVKRVMHVRVVLRRNVVRARMRKKARAAVANVVRERMHRKARAAVRLVKRVRFPVTVPAAVTRVRRVAIQRTIKSVWNVLPGQRVLAG